MNKIVKITLWLPGQDALNEVLSKAKVHLGCGAPQRDTDGNYVITLYASPAEAKKITALPYRNQVDENYEKVLAERQKEVSKTDRFKGGKVKPTGLGERR
jgi:hypothetical protein